MKLVWFVGSVFIFFFILAAFSRVVQMKEAPDYIKNASDGVANLFKGALGQ